MPISYSKQPSREFDKVETNIRPRLELKLERRDIRDLKLIPYPNAYKNHLEGPIILNTSGQDDGDKNLIIEEDKTKEDCDTSVFSFTFNKEEQQKQVKGVNSVDETKASKKQIFSNSFQVEDSNSKDDDQKIIVQTSYDLQHTISKTPQLLKIQGKQQLGGNRNTAFNLSDPNTKQNLLQPLKKIEIEAFHTKARPISQVQGRFSSQESNDALTSNYSEEYSYNHRAKTKITQNTGDYNRVVQRASSSKVRPTSGMQHYLKGKLPDCFLIDSSPLSRKQPSQHQADEGFAYIDSVALHGNSPFTVKGLSEEANTRLHSAQTYINNPHTETDNQSKQRFSVQSNKPPLNPHLANPKRLMSGNSATLISQSYKHSGSLHQPVISTAKNHFQSRHDQILMNPQQTLMNPDQLERAAPSTSQTQRNC